MAYYENINPDLAKKQDQVGPHVSIIKKKRKKILRLDMLIPVILTLGSLDRRLVERPRPV